MKKLLLLSAACLSAYFSVSAQNVANTYWQAYDTTNSPELYWHFDADTCWYSINGIDYDSVSVFTETAGQFFITDIYAPGPNYCGGTGVYNKVFSSDTMWMVPVVDTCPTRPDYFIYRYFISIGSGVEQHHSSTEISVYPNPNSGTFTITSHDKIESVIVQDVWGKSVPCDFDPQNKSVRLLTSSNGLYFVTIHKSSGSVTEKIVIEN